MQFTYDNSAENARNPNHPPRRVLFGPQTTDEMGELWMQAVPRSHEDFRALAEAYQGKELKKIVATCEHKLRLDPNDAKLHFQLGKVRIAEQRFAEAVPHVAEVARIETAN